MKNSIESALGPLAPGRGMFGAIDLLLTISPMLRRVVLMLAFVCFGGWLVYGGWWTYPFGGVAIRSMSDNQQINVLWMCGAMFLGFLWVLSTAKSRFVGHIIQDAGSFYGRFRYGEHEEETRLESVGYPALVPTTISIFDYTGFYGSRGPKAGHVTLGMSQPPTRLPSQFRQSLTPDRSLGQLSAPAGRPCIG